MTKMALTDRHRSDLIKVPLSHFSKRLKNVYAFVLFVCLSVCTRSNLRKCTRNFMQIKIFIYVSLGMFSIVYEVFRISSSFTRAPKNFI